MRAPDGVRVRRVLGPGLQAPLTGLVLILEYIRTTGSLIVPIVTATATATTVHRYLDGHPIYSVRLPRVAPTGVPR